MPKTRQPKGEKRVEEQIRSEILKTIPYGFYITGVVGSDGEANGFTTCWVSQVSFDPQQVIVARSEEHTSELQSRQYLVCRLLLEKKKRNVTYTCSPL